MPDEKIQLNTESYPELQGLGGGDNVTLKISGKVLGNEGGVIEVSTENVEVEVDDAAQFEKNMSKQPAMEAIYSEEE